MADPTRVSAALLERLAGAVNSHDLDAVASCFTAGYCSETPAHPARGFTGRGQVRCDWEQIFTFDPASPHGCCDHAPTVMWGGRSGR